MTQRIIATVLLAALLLTGCSSPADRAEELFRACIEEGGGTTGDLVPMMEGAQLVVVAGQVDAPADLFDQCFAATNAELAGN
jgi:hypothetical protein